MKTIKFLILSALLSMIGCQPSEQDKARFAEDKRLECLDKICDGDSERAPKYDQRAQELIKRYGQFYLGPKEYATSGRILFHWPSKTPGYRGGDFPEKSKDFYAHSIEVFLTGRHRWPEPNAVEAWKGKGWEVRFEELQNKGYKIERAQVRPDLEIVRFTDPQGKPHDRIYYLASQQKKLRGEGRPGVSCDQSDRDRLTCTGGVFWQEDVYADFRFHGKHGHDWPAINEEITRILNLVQKAQK